MSLNTRLSIIFIGPVVLLGLVIMLVRPGVSRHNELVLLVIYSAAVLAVYLLDKLILRDPVINFLKAWWWKFAISVGSVTLCIFLAAHGK